jgi:hypothetical protein
MLKTLLKTTTLFLCIQLNTYASDYGTTDLYSGKSFTTNIFFNRSVFSNFNIASQQGNTATGESINYSTPDDRQYITFSYWPIRKYRNLDAVVKRAKVEQDSTVHCQAASFKITSRTSSALVYEYTATNCGPNHISHKTLSKLMQGKSGIYQFLYVANSDRTTTQLLNATETAVINSYLKEQ